MKTVLDAAFDLQAFVREQGWPFCFIGGLAVLRWGIERTTKDADMTVLTRFTMDEECASKLIERFAARFPNPMAIAQRSRFLPLLHESGVPMDVALACGTEGG